jgi:hypothetical protein
MASICELSSSHHATAVAVPGMVVPAVISKLQYFLRSRLIPGIRICSWYYLKLTFSAPSVFLIKNKWPNCWFESTMTPPPPIHSPGICTWTKSFPGISFSVSPTTPTTNGMQFLIAVNVNVSFTWRLFIDLESSTLYNEFVPHLLTTVLVARTNFGCSFRVPSNMYSVVSSVEMINSGSTGQSDVPHAVETISSNIFVDSGNDFISALISESSNWTGMKCVALIRARLPMHAQMEFSGANLVVVFTVPFWKIEAFPWLAIKAK